MMLLEVLPLVLLLSEVLPLVLLLSALKIYSVYRL